MDLNNLLNVLNSLLESTSKDPLNIKLISFAIALSITLFAIQISTGAILSILLKEVARFGAKANDRLTIYRNGEYEPLWMRERSEEDLRRGFSWASNTYDFIIVEREGEKVLSERLYDFIGESETAMFEDGKCTSIKGGVPTINFTFGIPAMLALIVAVLFPDNDLIQFIGSGFIYSFFIFIFLTAALAVRRWQNNAPT